MPPTYEHRRLVRNLKLNGVTERVVTDLDGFSDEKETRTLYVSDYSNFYSIHLGCIETKPDRFDRTEPVPIRRGEDWISDQGVSQADIDVNRIDVQGAESNVLCGLP